MATATFNTLQFLHVAGAMVVVGYLAIVPMWRAAVARSADAGMLRGFLETAQNVQMRVVVPALAVLLVTGLLMTVGPLREGYNIAVDRYSQAGLVMAIVLGFMIVSGLGGPAKKMLTLIQNGEGTGPAMDKLWSEWRTALISAAVLSLAATALMVFGARN